MNGRSYLFLAAGALLAMSTAAFSHGAASWIQNGPYFSILTNQPEVRCCGEHDCEMWPEEDVESRPEGYYLKSTGETIPYNKTYFTEHSQALKSKFWRCHNYEMTEAGKGRSNVYGTLPSTFYKTRCFFGPGGDS